MTVLVTLPRAVYPANTYPIVPTVVPLGLGTFSARLDRFAWPDTGADVISANFLFSYDGGLTWPKGVGFTATGGSPVYKGVPVTFSSVTIPLGDTTNALRMVKGVVVTTVALDTSVTIEGL